MMRMFCEVFCFKIWFCYCIAGTVIVYNVMYTYALVITGL